MDIERKLGTVKYPVKLGYFDKSGKDQNIITDANDRQVVGGNGDCCGVGGIDERNIALALIKALNKARPKFKVSYFQKVTN